MPARHQQNTEYIHINIRCQFYISIKTGEWEISNINCAQTQPADLTHILDRILLRRLLQKQALGKEAHLHQRTFFAKNDLLRVYTVCFLRFCVFCFSCVCKFLEETTKVSITCHQSLNPPQHWLPFRRAPVCWNPVWPELWVDHVFF